MTKKGQVPKGVCRQRPLARRAALGATEFSASCASATGPQRRLTSPSADPRLSRKDGEAARQGRALTRTCLRVPILGTQAAIPFTAKGQSLAAVDFAGASGPGHRAGKSACTPLRLRCDRPLWAGPSVRGPACSRTPAPSQALRPPLGGPILVPATPG